MATTTDERTSDTVRAIEDVYLSLRKNFYSDLPPVAVTIGRPHRKNVLGSFHACQWSNGKVNEVHAFHISSMILNEKPEDILKTIVHESVHALAEARDIEDTSRMGKYHNKRFKTLAEECGLVCERDKQIGWTTPALSERGLKLYSREIKIITRASGLYQVAEIKLLSTSPSRMLKASCECNPPRIIRAALKTFESDDITCGACGSPFTLDV